MMTRSDAVQEVNAEMQDIEKSTSSNKYSG
jgi:hypothetical protein